MCGIFACSPIVEDWLRPAIQSHHTRGPDQAAVVKTNWPDARNIGLAINRLAITGIGDKNGQPIKSRTGRSFCILNGAIYNHKELIEEFGMDTSSENDGSVIVELYEQIGIEFVNYLRGMFSFVLVDLSLRKVIVARDTLGIKPLFWAKNRSGQVAFSSTLRAIPNELAVHARSFKAGTLWVRTQYDEMEIGITPRIKPDLELEPVLRKSVQLHIPTDVKWGASLSGGVDSSLVCALARSSDTYFPCYSLYLGESEDFIASKLTAKYLDLELRPVEVQKDDIVQAIPRVIYALGTFEKDMVVGGLGSYLTAKAAQKDGCKVLLNGLGADEVFGGYPHYGKVRKGALRDRLIFDQSLIGNRHCAFVEQCSMAMSVESRVPLFDAEVVATARRIPNDKLIDNKHAWRTKIALREVASNFLPEPIYTRGKMPMGRGSGLRRLFSEVIEKFGTNDVSPTEARAYKLKNMEEAAIFSIWKRKFGAFSTGRADLFERSLVNFSS